ncbi:MAG: conjugal transfer protein TraX [Methanocorpusculum parvum]|nr:conjugal transfer protein TraX [Methanocorpusculum parvum]
MAQKFSLETTSASLHIFAMAFMLCDHLWGTVIPGNEWLTCIGRLALPIFAFLLVEGYFHTKNLKKYAGRLFIFALISEIPFNLMMGGSIFYPIHQNILFSFLIALGLIHLNEKAKASGKISLRVLTGCGTVILGYILGILTMVDFYHAGILTVLVFYFLRGKKWWCYIGQFLCLWYINCEILGGLVYEFASFTFPQQGFALFALLFIWLYRGKQGYHSKPFQYFCYAFYPAHMLILSVLRMLLLS